MKEVVEFLSRALVDNPEAVVVREEKNNRDLLYYVQVASEDLGKMIGKKGRTAKAVRSLLNSAGKLQNMRVNLEILEPEAENEAIIEKKAATEKPVVVEKSNSENAS